MADEDVRSDRPAPGVLRLTLDRPHAHNAISIAMQRQVDALLSDAAADDSVRVVVLAGAGDRAFCAGYDLKELAAMTPRDAAASMAERDELLWRYLSFPKPTVAAVDGMAYGAGTLYAACSDLRVGGPNTSMAVSAAKYGGVNLTWLLDTLIGAARARDMLMTARAVPGREAYAMGLLTRYDAEVSTAALRTAEDIAAQPPDGLRHIKHLLLAGPGRTLRSRYDHETSVVRAALGQRPVTEMFSTFFSAGAASKTRGDS
ncbi:crotonase [Nocardia sp. 852002-51101_SCH5132738]|uniref:enoyl-CoA hydratase/isomerase family protein n=1 Tax=Nocardia TaxID=1817 RepID=UPI0007E938BA|nr:MULTISPECIES: enoyl-CoA hydratase/isomerase family protein [Nocardia]MBF6277489.1 enoyl-CoA hydratase/isomerase family protein [Nocardia nova]OBA53476.1 crotonase [Nocardia sp. 852002-51101_SCH5132738]OBF66744.1 crotonase [Mycobacterium sp. 852002-51759_SCH5129042]